MSSGDYAAHPRLQAVAFNGRTAATIGRRALGDADRLALIDLPSSSAALTRPFAEKAMAWAAIGHFIGVAHGAEKTTLES